MPPTTASSVAAGARRPVGLRSTISQQPDEGLDRGLIAVVDAAARAQTFDQGDAGKGRFAREQIEQCRDRVSNPVRPLLSRGGLASGDDLFADLRDRRVVGGYEALVLTFEVLVEVALGNGRLATDE